MRQTMGQTDRERQQEREREREAEPLELSLEHGTQILTQCPRRTIDMPDVRWRTMDAPPHRPAPPRRPVPPPFPPCSQDPAALGKWASQCSADRLAAAAPAPALPAEALPPADWAYAWPRAPMYSAANWCRYARPGVAPAAAAGADRGAAACVARCRRWHDSASSRNWPGYAALAGHKRHKNVQSV